jgi:hypothetical protein
MTLKASTKPAIDDEPTVVIPASRPAPAAGPDTTALTEVTAVLKPVPVPAEEPASAAANPEPAPEESDPVSTIFLVAVPGSSTPMVMWSLTKATSVADFLEGGAVVAELQVVYDSRSNPPLAEDSAAAISARAALHLPLPDAA